MNILQSLFLLVVGIASLLLRAEPTFVFQVGNSAGMETWVVIAEWFMLRAVIAIPIAYFAKRKGYSWWGFFLIAWMFMPAASIAMLIALPRLQGDKVVRDDAPGSLRAFLSTVGRATPSKRR